MSLKIGDTIWLYDQNRRVYRPKQPGEIFSSGGPIYREHWRPLVIVAENSRSWITEHGNKCPKKGDHFGWCISEKELDDDCFVNDNRHKISDKIRSVNDADLLRAVAKLIGHEP